MESTGMKCPQSMEQYQAVYHTITSPTGKGREHGAEEIFVVNFIRKNFLRLMKDTNP
jgi:hypothetical protein